MVTLVQACELIKENYPSFSWKQHGWTPVGKLGSSILFDRAEVLKSKRMARGRVYMTMLGSLSTRDSADYLGLSYSLFRRRFQSWGVPYYTSSGSSQSGQVYRFREAELHEWLQSRKGLSVLAAQRRRTRAKEARCPPLRGSSEPDSDTPGNESD